MGDELLEPLAWDSEFFGVPIARVALDGATPEFLADVEREAHERGIRCVYGTADPTRDEPSHLAQAAGFLLVEVAMTFGHLHGDPVFFPPTDSTCRWGNEDDLAVLEQSIALLAPWSRYAQDPRFGLGPAGRLFQAWVARAASADDDRYRLVVAENESGITGLSTITLAGYPRVDLLASTKPAAGVAEALFNFLIDWCDEPVEAGPIAARNIACLRVAAHCGFRPIDTRYIFHKWYDDPEPGP